MIVYGIDPGPSTSHIVQLNIDIKTGRTNIAARHEKNNKKEMRGFLVGLNYQRDSVVIEDMDSYYMPVGNETFDTLRWIGRFIEMPYPFDIIRMTRRTVKLWICNSVRAKDKNISAAMIGRYGEKGTKKNPGQTYGFSNHYWPALAVATTFIERDLRQRMNVNINYNLENPSAA